MYYVLQTNLYAILIAVIVLISLYAQRGFTQYNQKHFFRMIVLTIMLLFVDMTAELVNGQTGIGMRWIHYFSATMLFALSGFVGVYWYMYIYHHFYDHRLLSKREYGLLFGPAFLMVILALYSLIGDGLFNIDAENIYRRGRLFMFNAAIMYGYAIFTIIMILRHVRFMRRRDSLALLSVPVFPIVGGIVQIIFYGILLLWPMTVLSLLMVYIFIQSKRLGIDTLTQLQNRREYDLQVKTMGMGRKGHDQYAVMMIDINNFKKINDTHGHHRGDQVLRYVAKMLKEVFYPINTLYRIGGDEFFILYRHDGETAVEKMKASVRQAVQVDHPFPFELELSIGAATYQPNQYPDFISFVSYVDGLMYVDKRQQDTNTLQTVKT